jgi:hypothetical protein
MNAMTPRRQAKTPRKNSSCLGVMASWRSPIRYFFFRASSAIFFASGVLNGK